MVATRLLVMEGFEWSAVATKCRYCQHRATKGRDIAMATIFWLSMYGVHIGARLNHPCAAWRRCGLMLNYFDHLLGCMAATYAAYCYRRRGVVLQSVCHNREPYRN